MNDRKPTVVRNSILDHIIRNITLGSWKPGERIPSESALVDQFGASRMTVHHALRELAARGFLTRRKGSGSFVALPKPYVSQYNHLDIVDEIESRGWAYSARVIIRALRKALPEEARGFGLPDDGEIFHALIVHHADGVPFELEDRLLNPSILPNCMEVDLSRRSLFSMLMLSRPYRNGTEAVRAILCSEDDRRLLALTDVEPCLEITRKTWSHDGIVTMARMVRAGQKSSMEGTITVSAEQANPSRG